MVNFPKLFRSFKYAFAGIFSLFKHENNARFHFWIAILVLGCGYFFQLSQREWALVSICIFLVFAAEAFNTAIEKLCDKLHPDKDPAIGSIKDLAAAGVLFVVLGAIITGLIIFIPKFYTYLGF